MIRTKGIVQLPSVDAIISADWHIREDVPECRMDDFQDSMWKKILFVKELQEQYNCPVLLGGDLLDYWKPSPELLTKIIENFPKDIFTVLGNHDLPQHKLELVNKCGIRTLQAAKTLTILPGTHWGMPLQRSSLRIKGRKIAIWHIHTWHKVLPWKNCTSSSATSILKNYDIFDLIITGDNHIPFVIRDNGRLLINPGSLMRQTADQIDYKPAVWLYSAETNEVSPVYFPIDQKAVSREHLESKEIRNSRIEAFITKMNDDWATTLDFEENLRRFFNTNEIDPEVVDLINEALNNVKLRKNGNKR